MNEGAQGGRPVLIVEDRAHEPCGHYPCSFAELAEAYSDLGRRVEVSTARGWLHEHGPDARFVVHRYGPLALWLHELANRMRGLRGFGAAGSAVRRTGQLLWVAVMMGRARSLWHRVADPPADVIVLSIGAHPVLAGAWVACHDPFVVDPDLVDLDTALEGAERRPLRTGPTGYAVAAGRDRWASR